MQNKRENNFSRQKNFRIFYEFMIKDTFIFLQDKYSGIFVKI